MRNEENDEDEEDPYESIYEEVNPPDRGGSGDETGGSGIGGNGNSSNSELFFGSESEFDEIAEEEDEFYADGTLKVKKSRQ